MGVELGHSAVHLSVVAHAYFGPSVGMTPSPYAPEPLGMVGGWFTYSPAHTSLL